MASDATRSGPEPGTLAEFAVSTGEPRSAAANRPVRLDNAGIAWFVERGALDVFLAEYRDGEIRSGFKHVLRLEPGRLAFGVEGDAADSALRLVSKGLPETRLHRVPIPLLLNEIAKNPGSTRLVDDLIKQVDAWIGDFAAALAQEVVPRPRPTLRLCPAQDAKVATTGVLAATRGVAWLCADDLEADFLDVAEAGLGRCGLMPVTQEAWVNLRKSEGVACLSSRALRVETLLRHALREFHRLALDAEAVNRRLLLADEVNLQAARISQRTRDEAAARMGLADLSDTRRERPAIGDSPLVAAMETIGRHEGLSIRVPVVAPGDEEPTLPDILDESGVRARRVRLSAEDRWWIGDCGALLVFRRKDDQPMVLLPGAGGRYRLLDPSSGKSRRADSGTTSEILEDAWFLYRTLPGGQPVGMKDLFKAAGGNLATDLIRLATAGVGAGLLTLAPAVAVNVLVESAIPSGDAGLLIQLTGVFVGVALVAALSQMLRGTALMRLEGRVAARLGAAIWDRLLRLQSGFFRTFTAGELAVRAMAFQSLRDSVSGVAADALLSMFFLLPALALVFFYDDALGWLTLGFSLVSLAVISILAVRLLSPQRRYLALGRRLTGDLLQFLNGIFKLRATGTEASAFAAWANRFRELKRAEIRISALTEHAAAFGAALPALGTAVLFAAALRQGQGQLATADFLAVYAASMVLYTAVLTLGQSLQAIASVVPGCEQVRPILEADADSAARGGARVMLEGEIAFHRVSFRYSEDGPQILRDVSLHARPGELVAIVGESGSGKSTLFRLALGLETPTSGAVYYDGKDLAHLDRDAVRRQVGVVTQDGSLLGGNVLNNIVGVGQDVTVDDAWRAARQAAVDRDIAAMPMEMFTVVGESGSTFSGGQQQRIRIAAALVHDPRVMLLDEPTSWLDNRSQSETMEGIEKSVATRIVIAHRLSTIRNANRIYVLQAGRIVQAGEFDELIEEDGPFRDLALRQMV